VRSLVRKDVTSVLVIIGFGAGVATHQQLSAHGNAGCNSEGRDHRRLVVSVPVPKSLHPGLVSSVPATLSCTLPDKPRRP